MKKLIVLLTIVAGLVACVKVKDADPTLYIRGRIFVKDNITEEEIKTSKANFVVKLASDSNKTDYIYSSKASSEDGYFVFDIPAKKYKEDFYVSCTATVNNEEYTSKGMLVPTDGDNFKEFTLNMYLNLKTRTYLFLKTLDIANQPIPNTKVYMYINQSMAASGNTATASYTYATNPLGELKVKDIPKGTYYVKASAIYTSTVPISSTIFNVVLDTGKVASYSVTLQ